jgi:hypothetical protein
MQNAWRTVLPLLIKICHQCFAAGDQCLLKQLYTKNASQYNSTAITPTCERHQCFAAGDQCRLKQLFISTLHSTTVQPSPPTVNATSALLQGINVA